MLIEYRNLEPIKNTASIDKESKQWEKDRDSVKIRKSAPSMECRK